MMMGRVGYSAWLGGTISSIWSAQRQMTPLLWQLKRLFILGLKTAVGSIVTRLFWQ